MFTKSVKKWGVRKSVTLLAVLVIAASLGAGVTTMGCGGSSSGTPATTFTLASDDITAGTQMALAYVQALCGGTNFSPQLTWTNAPTTGVLTFAVTMRDTAATTVPANYIHWILYNIPTTVTSLDQGAAAPAGASFGLNDSGNAQYDGPCPPTGENHTYQFKVWALTIADLETDPNFDALVPASIITAIDANDTDSATLSAPYLGP